LEHTSDGDDAVIVAEKQQEGFEIYAFFFAGDQEEERADRDGNQWAQQQALSMQEEVRRVERLFVAVISL
jgi:hypothetical protein